MPGWTLCLCRNAARAAGDHAVHGTWRATPHALAAELQARRGSRDIMVLRPPMRVDPHSSRAVSCAVQAAVPHGKRAAVSGGTGERHAAATDCITCWMPDGHKWHVLWQQSCRRSETAAA